jgi:hypothetical protein
MPTVTFKSLAVIGGNTNSVVLDAAGDLFGTTQTGGTNDDGSVFEIANTSTGYASAPTVLVSFNGPDGDEPNGPLLLDAAGDLFGTTREGGSGFSRFATGDGALFEIANTSTGYATIPTTVVSFTNAGGTFPVGGLIADSAGNLLGVTQGNVGTVFEVAKTSSGYAGTPATLTANAGNDPQGGVMEDSAGNLFGTTAEGGANAEGNVFEIANTATGYASTPVTLVSFNNNFGRNPGAGLIVDAAGDLFGIGGGGADGDGALFEIVNTSTGYANAAILLASFTSVNGPYGNLIEDAAGNFFVTSELGGANADGAVYEIADTGNGYAISPVYSLDGTNGKNPGATLTADAAGDLFGTDQFGAASVFELTGSGFQVAPPASAPTVVSITALPNTGDAATGTLVTLTATMSAAVTVSGGIPALTLNDGGTATYDAAKSSGTALVFDYTVASGQSTSALAVSGFDANGATIQDALGDNASFVMPPTLFANLAVNFAILANFNFSGVSGEGPFGGLIADAAGDLFGTTQLGGTNGDGTVFEIVNTSTGYTGTAATLVNFNGGDGNIPVGDLLADSAGNLFGTTAEGGASSDGTVFEIGNTGSGYASIPATLATFNRANGAFPQGRLISDAAGDLFGTTQQGGQFDPSFGGTVFEIPFVGGSYASTPTTLVAFNGTDGALPQSGLIIDASGDLIGTTEGGPTSSTVFEIANTSTGYASTPTTLVSFNSPNEFGPVAGLVADAAGDLFGVGSGSTGGVNNAGNVFEIPFVGGHYASTPTILLTFNGQDGDFPEAPLIVDAAGDLFGTTTGGGTNNDGTVFEIANTSTGYASTATVLLSFNGTDGSEPAGRLLADSAGDLFGTTPSGGVSGNGTAFELTDTAFQVACYRSGTRIATPSGERAIESLAKGDAVLLASGDVQPVIWIGQRRIDCRRHEKPEYVWPVRVRAGAFGAGLPRRDLWLSPDHAVFVAGVLIPVKYLTNGTSIDQVPVAGITYCHLELPRHAIVLAEGLPAESWLDIGGRPDSGDAIRLLPDFLAPRPNPAMLWEARGCAPLIVAGQKLAEARMLVASHATAVTRRGRTPYEVMQFLPAGASSLRPEAMVPVQTL